MRSQAGSHAQVEPLSSRPAEAGRQRGVYVPFRAPVRVGPLGWEGGSPYRPMGRADGRETCLSALFSHSRIASFENCPKQFEFRYVQKIERDTESIEAFVGKRVHEVFERLYQFTDRGLVPGLEKVVDRYHKLWEEAFDGERVRVVREGASVGEYRALGERCVRSYYLRHYPFDQGETLGLEKRIVFPLDEAGQYRVQGIIDRISRARDGVIEVHDYKTGARVPSQKTLDEDRQLALYQLGLARELGPETPFRLVWHYVAKDATRVSTRTRADLERLRETTIAAIDTIRTTTEFPTRKSALCNWCEYRSICPAFPDGRPARPEPAPGGPAATASDDAMVPVGAAADAAAPTDDRTGAGVVAGETGQLPLF